MLITILVIKRVSTFIISRESARSGISSAIPPRFYNSAMAQPWHWPSSLSSRHRLHHRRRRRCPRAVSTPRVDAPTAIIFRCLKSTRFQVCPVYTNGRHACAIPEDKLTRLSRICMHNEGGRQEERVIDQKLNFNLIMPPTVDEIELSSAGSSTQALRTRAYIDFSFPPWRGA